MSTDRIAFPAMRCAVLLADLRRRYAASALDPAGTGLVCEAYPDPALRLWTGGDQSSLGARESYKGPLRGRLAQCIVNDDCFDALVCALVARAAALNRTLAPEDARLAATEGWIHLPACELAELSAR